MLIVLHRCLFPGAPRNVKRDTPKGKKESTNAASHVKSVQMELMSTEQVGCFLLKGFKGLLIMYLFVFGCHFCFILSYSN